MSEPFQYRGKWYIWYYDRTGKRRRKKIGDTKREAHDRWKAGLRAGNMAGARDPKFSTVADAWLAKQEERLSRGLVSAQWVARVSRTVLAFLAVYPRIRVSQITPEIAVDWIPQPRTLAYERTEAGTLKQILKWAVPGMIEASPLAHMKLEKGERRERLIAIEEHRTLARLPRNPGLRVLLWFCWWTGARPIELRHLRWEMMDADCTTAVLRKHKTAKKTGRPRVLYFNGYAQTILRRHRKLAGPVFTNERGKPWTKDALCRRVRYITKKSGIDVSAYAYRHSFITRALVKGVDVATVAELAGTSVEMISRNYGHLDKAKDHLAEAAKQI